MGKAPGAPHSGGKEDTRPVLAKEKDVTYFHDWPQLAGRVLQRLCECQIPKMASMWHNGGQRECWKAALSRCAAWCAAHGDHEIVSALQPCSAVCPGESPQTGQCSSLSLPVDGVLVEIHVHEEGAQRIPRRVERGCIAPFPSALQALHDGSTSHCHGQHILAALQ